MTSKALEFRAAILERSRNALSIENIQFSGELSHGQVLVKILFSGVCGAQINEIDAVKGPDMFLPHLLGHEGYGEVVSVGPGVRQVEPGQNVVLHWMQGEGIQSEPPKYRSAAGQVVNAGWVTTFSEYSVVSENRCTPVKSNLPQPVLPLFGCGATTAAGVVGKEAKVRLGESVVVLGSGGVGLLAIMAARRSGANVIVGVDISESRLQAAREMGASVALLAKDNLNLGQEIVDSIGGQPDVVIETSGAREMIELAYLLAQPKGRAILVGVPRADDPALIETLPLHFGMVFTGSKGGSAEPSKDIPLLVKAAEAGLFPVQDLPYSIYPLSQLNVALDHLRSGGVGRMVISCQE